MDEQNQFEIAIPSGTPDAAEKLIRQLHEDKLQLTATVSMQQETVTDLQATITRLEQTQAILRRSLFGHRRERFECEGQSHLFDLVDVSTLNEPSDCDATDCDEMDAPSWLIPSKTSQQTSGDTLASQANEASAVQREKKTRRSNRILLDALPRERREQLLDPNDIPEHLRDKEQRRFFRKVGQWIECVPASFVLIEDYVETLAVDNEDQTATEMVSAPTKPRIISSLAGPSLLAYLVVSRFFDHLPYYRLEDILHRHELHFSRSTQSRWISQLIDPLSPLIDLMRARALASWVVQADETPVKFLDREYPGKARKAYFWAVLGNAEHPYSTFYFTKDRSRAGPEQIFGSFHGTLVSDAYICYETLSAESMGRIVNAGCHAHARRKFEALHDLGATPATTQAMAYFQRLFSIEDQLRNASAESRHDTRQRLSRPLLDEFHSWMNQKLETLTPKHNLRGPIQYMTKRWDCFTRFLDSGDVPIDNNAAERAVKLPVMGKKAWLFVGSEQGGEAAATMFTLMATCRRLHINPLHYLNDVFERIPTCDPSDASHYESLLPDRWLSEHPESRMEHREEEASDRAERKSRRRAARREEAVGSSA